MARPTKYSKALAAKICAMIAEGMSLRRICQTEGMPNKSSVLDWLAKYDEFSAQYARARELQAECIADEIIDIADDGLNDTYETDDGRQVTNYDVIQRSKLRVDVRKWYLAKVLPKKYGDKVTQEHVGPGGGPVQHAAVTMEDYLAARNEIKDDY